QSFDLTYFSTQSGLSNNIVYDIYQDSQGFIWVATENGLSRFDAYNFKNFHHSPSDSTSISSNTVRTIFEDKTGNLWFGTHQGLNKFDRSTQGFTRYSIPKPYSVISQDVIWISQNSE